MTRQEAAVAAVRRIRVAGVQVESRNLDVEGNLRRAEALVEVAAERGATLVLCPEFLAPGYVYDPSIWDAGEPRGGPTEDWLAKMARQHRIYIGASYLEASGDDFFNTFTLMKPDGIVAGRVRKQSLPGFEGWFFRGCSDSKVIETELGRIGVGICHDNNTARFMRQMNQEQVDLLLMPHSAPCMAMGPLQPVGDHAQNLLRGAAGFYAKAFGVPTVMANKAAGEDIWSPMPWVPLMRLRFHFIGQSTICDADGTVCEQLEEQEGVVVADVLLDAQQKRQPARIPSGYWSMPPTVFPRFPRASAALFQILERAGKAAYSLSRAEERRRENAARAILLLSRWMCVLLDTRGAGGIRCSAVRQESRHFSLRSIPCNVVHLRWSSCSWSSPLSASSSRCCCRPCKRRGKRRGALSAPTI